MINYDGELYSFYYDNQKIFIPDGFKSYPSVPRKLLDRYKVKFQDAELVARGHDFIYKYRIGNWYKANNWLFDALEELGYRFNIFTKLKFRALSWVWWIT